MRDEVIKVVQFPQLAAGWMPVKARKATVMIKINHHEHTVDICNVGGRYLQAAEYFNIILTDKDICKELYWAATEYERKYPCRIVFKHGMSGAEDIQLQTLPNRPVWTLGWRGGEVVYSLHISMYGKLNWGFPKSTFSGDLLEIVAATCGDDFKEVLGDFVKGKRSRLQNVKYYYYPRFVNENVDIIHPTTPSFCGKFNPVNDRFGSFE